MKIVGEDARPPGELAALSPDLEKLILRCLRKDPSRRYQTMATSRWRWTIFARRRRAHRLNARPFGLPDPTVKQYEGLQ